MTTEIQFFVEGVPVGKGSMRAFMPKGGRFPVITHDNKKTKPWQSLISYTATEAKLKAGVTEIVAVPVSLTMLFSLPRPSGHFGSGKNAAVLKASAPREHISRPDVDKLCRLVCDSLSGILWKDDSQVTLFMAQKHYAADKCGVSITARWMAG